MNVTEDGLFHQSLTPIGGSLAGSFFVGIIPIFVVLILLGVVRLAAWIASAVGLAVGILIAIFGWGMPAKLALLSIANGISFALWPIMWIVINAMIIYNLTVRSGKFDIFRRWMIHNTPADRRILVLIIGFSFGALLEGVAGFGTPGAICSSLMVSLGFDPIEALTLTLLFDTTPVAFGALGVPITTLAQVTGLSSRSLSAMVGRQLPIFSLLLPFYVIWVYGGWRSVKTCWPVSFVSGFSFALIQCVIANLVGPELPDVLAAIASLLSTIVFVQFWKPSDSADWMATLPSTQRKDCVVNDTLEPAIPVSVEMEGVATIVDEGKPSIFESIIAWFPWLAIVVFVIIWTFAKVPNYGARNIEWPGLHNAVYLTLYGKKYAAIYSFQPLATGTCILCVAILWSAVLLVIGAKPKIIHQSLVDTWKQLHWAILTVILIMGLAYLFNYSGIAYTIGLTLSSVGNGFPFLSVFLGWIACFLSGSDTSANALFGNLQVVAARQIGLSALLMAAANSSGGVLSKMISPQNLTTGVSTIGLVGKESKVFRKTFPHSVLLIVLMGFLNMFEQFVIHGIIPPDDM